MWSVIDDPVLGRIETARFQIGGWETRMFAAGTGPAVLLLHGSSIAVDSRLTWFRLFPALAVRHRVIMFDQPGFGDSEIPGDLAYPDRLARSDHALAVMAHLDLPDIAVVGHSEGGFIATRLALLRPDRVRALVIATSGGTAPMLNDERDAVWMAASAAVYDYPARTVGEAHFVQTEMALRQRPDADFESLLVANFRRDRASGHVEMLRRRAAAQTRFARYTELQEQFIHPYLPRLGIAPTLLWADRDATVPVARGERLAAILPRCILHVLPEAGHWLMHDRPRVFQGLVADAIHGTELLVRRDAGSIRH